MCLCASPSFTSSSLYLSHPSLMVSSSLPLCKPYIAAVECVCVSVCVCVCVCVCTLHVRVCEVISKALWNEKLKEEEALREKRRT